jgi:hypothetical protein
VPSHTSGAAMGPDPDSCTATKQALLDHLVCAVQRANWDFYVQRLRRVQIDHESKFGVSSDGSSLDSILARTLGLAGVTVVQDEITPDW